MKLTPYNPQRDESNHQTSSSSSSSATTERDALELIEEVYLDCIGRRMPGIAREETVGFLNEGMSPAVIMLALDETAGAPRPSWAYCRAILAGCLRDGAKTAEDYRARNDRWAGRRRTRQEATINPALDYSQRTYTKEEQERLFVNFDELA